MDHFKSLYWICYNIAFVLCFGVFFFFGHNACGILAPQPGIEPAPPALEGEVLTTGPPGKSLSHVLRKEYLVSSRSAPCLPCPVGAGRSTSKFCLTERVRGVVKGPTARGTGWDVCPMAIFSSAGNHGYVTFLLAFAVDVQHCHDLWTPDRSLCPLLIPTTGLWGLLAISQHFFSLHTDIWTSRPLRCCEVVPR